MHRFRRTGATLGLLLMAQFTLAEFAHAVILNWTNDAGGPAGVAGNWNPAQVPTGSDWLKFDLNSTYTVTFGANAPASDYLAVGAGNVRFRFPTAHTVNTYFGIGSGDADLTVESGSLTALGNFFVGHVATDSGTITFTGGTTSATFTDEGASTVIGDQGIGVLNVLDGATLTFTDSPVVGDRSGGRGTIIVGGVSETSPFPRARLVVNNLATDPMEVGEGGRGGIGVILGGQMDVAGTLELGAGSSNTGSGSLLVGGFEGSDSARVTIGGDLWIGRNDIAFDADTGLVSVTSQGVVDVAGDTYTFDPEGGDGQLEIREGGRFETGSLFVGDPASELDFTGGFLQVRGGTLDLNGESLTLNSTTGTPRLELHDGAQANLHTSVAPALNIGENAAGTLNILYGSDLHVYDHNVLVGDDPGGTGVLAVSHGGSSLTVDQALIVGRAGGGTFNANVGGDATLFTLGVATQASGVGDVNIDGTGTNVHVTDLLEVAGTSGGASGGDGKVNISDNANLWLDRAILSGDVWPTGEISVQAGGNLRLAGALVNRGVVELGLGNTIGGAIQPIAGGRITGSGSASSSIFAVLDTTGRITPDGPLHLGDPSSPLGFHFLGTLDVPIGETSLYDADSAVVGTVVMTGGTLHGPNGGIHVPLDRRVTGSGTITGPIRPVGRIIATNPAGLTFLGPVLGVGQGMNGTLLRFGPGGSFIGFGRLDASVTVDSAGAILPISDVTLGRAPLASRVTIDGVLAVAPGVEVDLNGTDTTRVSGLISMVQGYIENAATSPLLVKPMGRIVGNGTIIGATVNDGQLDPAPNANDLRFGALTQRTGGRLRFDVGDFASGELDTVTVDGVARLNGVLELHSLPGYAPVVGDSFPVIAYGSRVGSFSEVTLDGQPTTGMIQMVYHPTRAWARIVGAVGVGDPVAGAVGRLHFASMGSPARSMVFGLELPEASRVTVELFDLSGRRVATVQDGELGAGRHRFDASTMTPVAGGLYFARATVHGPQGTVVRTARATRLP